MPYPPHRLGLILATGLGLATSPHVSQAAILDFHWNGLFTMLSPDGAALENSSLPKGANRFQTPIDGTLQIDTLAGTGQVLMVPFFFFGNPQPALASGFELQAIGDGMGGSGSLLLANLLFNWNSGIGIPVSMVLDAAGLYGAIASGGLTVGSQITATGANPASDGTWIGGLNYLTLGPTPIATTDWNTSLIPGCTLGDCLYFDSVGTLPLVTDTAANAWRYEVGTAQLLGDGIGVGGSPMLDGPFQGYNINFDFTELTVTAIAEVPLPAALWLFGAGLLGLLGSAWRGGNQNQQGGQ